MTDPTRADLHEAGRKIHPFRWSILYVPFGAFSGFITVGLGYRATQHHLLSVTAGGFIVASQYVTAWLKWIWAPAVDITLSPKRWYFIATVLSAVGIFAMAVTPLNAHWLWLLTVLVVASGFINSIVGMSVEAMISALTPADHIGRVSAWFQSGNLAGASLGGGLALYLFEHFTGTWVSGAVVAVAFLSCCVPLFGIPDVKVHVHLGRPAAAVKGVVKGLWRMLKSKAGMLSALLCMLPLGTGVAQTTMAQASVAAYWHATATDVEWMQGFSVALFTVIGCFLGGWVCDRINPRAAYSLFGLFLAGVATAMAFAPATVHTFYVGNVVYAVGVGLAYAGFTAVALTALGDGPAATGYNVFASLSNFPIWWLTLLLAWAADPSKGAHHSPANMLLTEAALGVAAVILFAAVTRLAGQRLFGRTETVAA